MGCARFVCRGWEGSLLSFSPWMRILRLLEVLLLSSGCTLAVFSMTCIGPRGGFHGSRYDWQSHVLDFVWPVLVGIGSCSPCSGCISHTVAV